MIDVKNLRKEFKKNVKEPGLRGSIKALFRPKTERVVAVDDISFHVPEGEILGFIGPNGAGKSTVIKMLTGILTPTSGKCTINGKNPRENRKTYVKEIGVVFGQRTQLWWDLPLRETYGVLKEMYEVPDDRFHKRMAFLNEVLELDSFITDPVRTLSLWMWWSRTTSAAPSRTSTSRSGRRSFSPPTTSRISSSCPSAL